MRWVGDEAMLDAADRLVRYMQSDTGRFFDVFAMEGDPNRFEWSDIVAVACLSVNVPAAVVDWLLRGEGAEPTARLLSGGGMANPTRTSRDGTSRPTLTRTSFGLS
jgi:hypothetical protein